MKEAAYYLKQLSIVLLSVSVGVIAVTQSGFNVQLSHWCGNPFRAAFISTAIGVLELLSIMPLFLLMSRTTNKTSIIRYNMQNLHCEISSHKMYLNTLIWPGICGVLWLSTAIFLTPILGFGLYFISTISGQIMSSVVMDHFGLCWNQIRPLSIHNGIGVLMALIGIILFQVQVVIDEYGHNDYNQRIGSIIGCSILSVLVGCCPTIQAALNGKLKLLMKGTTYQVTTISFTVTLSILLVISIITYWIKKDWFMVNAEEMDWYIFCGGLMGPFIVGIYVFCPQHVGLSATFIGGILGYLTSSLIFDHFGIFGVDETDITALKALGVTCVVIASVLINIKRDKIASNDLEQMVQLTTTSLSASIVDESGIPEHVPL